MAAKLKDFIYTLKHLNTIKGVQEIVTILEKMAADPRKRAEIEKDDNKIAAYIISIVTVYPDIMKHPKNDLLKKFIWTLGPTGPLPLPDFIRNQFFGLSVEDKPTPKRRLGTSK